MNQFIKSIIVSFSVFFTSSIFVLANAGSDYDKHALDADIAAVQAIVEADEVIVCTVERLVAAEGVQVYEAIDDGSGGKVWGVKGPLADLIEANNGHFGAKVGAHFQYVFKPAWAFDGGGDGGYSAISIASGASSVVIPSDDPDFPGIGNVAWLNVDLFDPNDLGYNKLFRVQTEGGVPPNVLSYELGARLGVFYKTFYVFLSCV